MSDIAINATSLWSREKAAVELIEKLHEYIIVLAEATDYIKPNTGVWHTTMIALDEIKDWRGPEEGEGK